MSTATIENSSISQRNQRAPRGQRSPQCSARSLPDTRPSRLERHWKAVPQQSDTRANHQSRAKPVWAPAWMSASRLPGSWVGVAHRHGVVRCGVHGKRSSGPHSEVGAADAYQHGCAAGSPRPGGSPQPDVLPPARSLPRSPGRPPTSAGQSRSRLRTGATTRAASPRGRRRRRRRWRRRCRCWPHLPLIRGRCCCLRLPRSTGSSGTPARARAGAWFAGGG